jgi:outer membrane protein TolC
MTSYTPVFFLFVVSAQLLSAQFLSEQKALLSGLEKRSEIKILRIENRIDSLEVETVRSQWLPQVSATAGIFYTPVDSTAFTVPGPSGTLSGGSGTPSIGAGESLTVAQRLPGGGVVAGGVTFNKQSYFRQGDSAVRASVAGLSYTQPLLRDAWSFGKTAYAVKIALLDNERFSLEQKKRLLSFCSDIRIRFWKLYEAQSLASLYRAELAYAQGRLAIERNRCSLGTSAPLDTLTAMLDYVNATARFHDAQSNALQAQEELAFYAGVADSQASIDSTLPVDCPPLPPPDEFIRRAENFDPQLRIFEVAAQSLTLTAAQTRNSFLPNLDFSASWSRSLQKNVSSGPESFSGNAVIGLIATYALPLKPRSVALAQSRAKFEKNSLSREQYRRELRLKIEELTRSWERERRAIEIAETVRTIARQTLSASRAGFAAGTVDRLSLDKAENDFREACVELLRKQLLMKQLEITFDELVGTTLLRFGVEMK